MTNNKSKGNPVFEAYIARYKEWKKDRKAKHEQTKALRRLKKEQEAYDKEYLEACKTK